MTKEVGNESNEVITKNGKSIKVSDETSNEVKNILTEELKQKIIFELERPDFPNLGFLYSKEVLDNAEEILKVLLEENKKDFEGLLKIKNEDITFESFEVNEKLSYFWALLNHYQGVKRGDKIDDIINNFRPIYSDFSNTQSYSKRYFDMIEYCLLNCELNSDQKRIIEKAIKSFKLRGIDLKEEEQDKLKDIGKELLELSDIFNNNVVKDKSRWSYLITDFDIIKILPESTLNLAKKAAQEENKEGYLFSSSPSMVDDILMYCESAEIRKDFADAQNSFCSSGEFDNRENILNILRLKKEKSEILGYANHAEFSLSKKMADSPEQIKELIEGISEKAKAKAEIDLNELKQYFNLEKIENWSLAFYERKYKEEKYKIDDKELKKYFEFEDVLSYLHDLVGKLYGIELKQIDIESYSEDIKTYEVIKDGKLISYYFLDAFYNSEKEQGAWADNLRTKDSFKDIVPVVLNVCDFQKISSGENLLTFSDVRTLFHEFGHGLHEILSESKYGELSGFGVEWDFIELPSQIHENWMTETDSLEKLSKHYKTGKSLDKKTLDKLDSLKTYMSGIDVSMQNQLALLDMYLYTDEIPLNIDELDKKTLDLVNRFSFLKRDENYKMYCRFSHIFSGPYSGGYYSYMWAEILEADVFEKIKDMGMFERETGELFLKTILGQGARKPAGELFKDFMGREVSNSAFMKRKGLK